jgi:hypothetical protein
MNFELETMTKTKITDVVVLSSKNRQPGDNPGAGLKFSMPASNDALSMFDGFLKSMLYSKSAARVCQGLAAVRGRAAYYHAYTPSADRGRAV